MAFHDTPTVACKEVITNTVQPVPRAGLERIDTGRLPPRYSDCRPMILRIVFGQLPSDIDAKALVEERGRLGRAARDVPGLESLIVGARRSPNGGQAGRGGDRLGLARCDADGPSHDVAEQERFLATRLQLPLQIDSGALRDRRADLRGLPPDTSYLRILAVRSRGRTRRLGSSRPCVDNSGVSSTSGSWRRISVGASSAVSARR